MLLPFISADHQWSGPLVCDPALTALNITTLGAEAFAAARAAYMDHGDADAAGLCYDGCAVVTLRPLDPAQESAAQNAAGPPELLGETIDARRVPVWTEAERDDRDPVEAVCAFIDGLPELQRAAYHRHTARQRRLMLERVCLALVDVSGWTAEAMSSTPDAMPPHGTPAFWRVCIDGLGDMRDRFILEVASHLQRVGSLTELGKARSGLLHGGGESTPAAPDGGRASNATSAPEPGRPEGTAPAH